jgi:D-glucosaminate-6-phosphate ammonia-lyase
MKDTRAELGLRPIINVSGTMTSLGASIVVPEAVQAMAGILPQFVEVNDLQRRASRAIAAACGAEAGFVTASAAAGITLAIAGCMTGADLAKIERLPDATGMKDEVAVQLGHMVGYGAPIDQAIRLAGAKAVGVGQATEVQPYQLEGALNARTAAVLFVVSHHTVQTGQLTLEEVVEIAHAGGVPVIVDGASEYDLRGFLARGADVAVYSAHKFLGGPTAGIVAGKLALVRAAFLQNGGIGRGMKVGKEGVAGAIAALEAWGKRNHDAVRAREAGYLHLWQQRLSRWPGIASKIMPDPTKNPLDRLEVHVDPAAARITAWDLADALASGDPPVIVRDHEVELGFFYLDPCNLHPGEEAVVADRFDQELDRARGANAPIATSLADRRRRQVERLLRWPD